MADYWKNRLFEAQKKWTDKDIDVINKILRHYYKIARENIVEDFEAVYDKVLAQAEEGKPITPADLTETINLVNSLKGSVSDATLLSQIPFITDVQSEIEAVREQKEQEASLYSFNTINFDDNEE